MSLRVVVADDSDSYRSALRLFLERLPEVTVVAEARNGAEAIERVQDQQPDLLILDMHMPHIDGWHVLQSLQQLECEVPVLVLSAYVDHRYQELALAVNLGAIDYISKGDLPGLTTKMAGIIAKLHNL